MGLRVWIWLLSLSVLWGGSFFFAKVAIGELGPLTVVFARVALAALTLDIVLLATRTNPFRRDAPWSTYLAMGLLNNVLPFSLIFWGQTQIASGLASILNVTTPLFTLVVAHFLTDDEKIDPAKVAALLTGLAGVALLIGPELIVGVASVWGELACLGAAISYAFAGVYGRRFKTMKIAPLEAAAGQVTASTVLILPIMLAVEQPWTLPAFTLAHGPGGVGRPGGGVDGPRLRPLFPHSGRRRRHQAAARHLPDTGHRRPAGRGRPGRTLGCAPLRRNGPDRRGPRRHRRPDRAPATPREIAVWRYNCASAGGLLGCP
jgi:drug/metabolite transporter (DMT)-like permease